MHIILIDNTGTQLRDAVLTFLTAALKPAAGAGAAIRVG